MSKYELEKKYKDISICEYNNRITRLRKEKMKLMQETQMIQMKIEKVQRYKVEFCEKVLGGHTLREEVESGIYGETFKVCSTCGLEV